MTKERREKLDEALDKLAELRQRWEQRLTLDNLALAERYIKGELRILVHLRSRLATDLGRYPEEYCAIFERVLPVGGPNSDRHREILGDNQIGGQIGNIVERASGIQDDAPVSYADRYQELVLIRNVETMETPKRFIPSLVRFGLLNQAHRIFGNSLYLSKVAGFKSLGALGNEKAGTIRNFLSVGADQFANQQVEGGSEIVDSVTGDGTPVRRRLARDLDLENQISGIRIVLGDDSIWFALLEPSDQFFETTDVLFGPFDLYPNAGEVGLGDHD